MGRTSGIGISEDHAALRDTVRRWAATHCPPTVPRAHLESTDDALPPFWDELAGLGWLGIHVPESAGGEGYGLLELSVVLEELGRWCAPGPVLPTALAAAVLAAFGEVTHHDRLAGLASGALVGTVAFASAPVEVGAAEGHWILDGAWEAVPSATIADFVVVPVTQGSEAWWAVLDASEVTVESHESIDRTRRVGRVVAEGVTVAPCDQLGPDPAHAGVADLAAVLVAAESVGLAEWCVATAAEHAIAREQFGRPIGQFQAVKHRCADMLCAAEQARAATWAATLPGAAEERSIAAAVAAALAPGAAYRCAKDCIQVLGGIGFTWEHDVHLYLKRCMANRLLIGPASRWHGRVAELAHRGVRHRLHIELPPEAEEHRRGVRAFLDDLVAHDKSEWNRRVADAGYLVPHWPRPWGRGAGPLEQLVVDDEFRRARVRRPHLAVGAWALPTIIVHGTAEQQDRFVLPTLHGELTWCQMFSEPAAGSDLASLTTRATRTDGGWLLSGQKVWTTMAHIADWGICLARTDPDAPKHDGIGCFLVDMSTPGLDIRPLRELTGAEMFNEVFLTDVFVPDECVVGGPTDGWRAARTTLGNERVSMGSGASMGPTEEALTGLAGDRLVDDPLLADLLGSVLATGQSLAAMGTRSTLRALSGSEPGPEASIRKLLGVEHDQRVQEVGLDLLGPPATAGEGDAALWVGGFLGNRSLSIAGGTSEIQRNLIAERLLGLPRDP